MVSVQRRLNSTGRKRVVRDRVEIEFWPPLDTFSFPSATATINLNDLELDPTATVVLEAYFRSSSMRFACGTVAITTPPARMILTDIDRGGAIQFRLLVIAADGTGRIIASAEGLKPRQRSDLPEREPLLPVRETDIDEELWRIDLTDREGPWLVLNSRIPDLAVKLRSDPVMQGLILPHALREVLRHLPSEGEDEDDLDWGQGWRKFLQHLDVATEADEPKDEEAIHEWIEEAVDRFCRIRRFAAIIRTASHVIEAENA